MTAKKLGIAVPLLLSHRLYARLGFQTRQPLSVVPGPALNIKFAGYDMWLAIEASSWRPPPRPSGQVDARPAQRPGRHRQARCRLQDPQGYVSRHHHAARRHAVLEPMHSAAQEIAGRDVTPGLLLLYALKPRNYIALRRRSLCPR
jgi:hypothetical protein